MKISYHQNPLEQKFAEMKDQGTASRFTFLTRHIAWAQREVSADWEGWILFASLKLDRQTGKTSL